MSGRHSILELLKAPVNPKLCVCVSACSGNKEINLAKSKDIFAIMARLGWVIFRDFLKMIGGR